MRLPAALRSLAVLVAALLCCIPAGEAAPRRRAAAAPIAEVRYRPADPLPVLGPDARIDAGLRAAAEELAASATRPDARLTPTATRLALGRAGYPGDARFVRAIAGAEPPAALLDSLPRGEPIDVGWAWRELPDGSRWWVVGWAPRRAKVDPIRRDLPLDGAFPLRVDGVVEPRLFVGEPEGGVREVSLTPGVSRWLDVFHVPGEYRLEVLAGDRVELLFSVYVDSPVPAAAPLPGPALVPDAQAAEVELGARLRELRARTGAAPLQPFEGFVPLARAHAACVASLGVAQHASTSCPGVRELAVRTFHPRARHYEDVAAADTVDEAWERLLDSPAHRATLACPTCTHVSVGAAVEPASPPRVFVVWELLEFPEGEPVPIPFTR